MDDAIRYLSRTEIDSEKWDQCINQAPNGLVYAYSFYLDSMCKNWDALVLGDYTCVMPLPWKRKFTIYYLYQPFFTASLGIFGKEINDHTIKQFIDSIPAYFRLVEINLNYGNNLSVSTIGFQTRNNYILDLTRTYQEIQARYRTIIRRNCKKAEDLDCRYSNKVPIDKVILLSKKQMASFSNIRSYDFNQFENLYRHLLQKGKAMACGVYTAKNVLVASGVFFFSHNRAYYILVGNHPNGKAMGASHYLIDRFIFEHAGKNLLLDFEGSDISNLAFFYSSFGAVPEIYPSLRINRLPWWVKIFKKR